MVYLRKRVLVVRCSKCGAKVFKYLKVGEGRLLRCWKDRILKNYSICEGELVKCPVCGNVVGTDEGPYIKMRQHAFTA